MVKKLERIEYVEDPHLGKGSYCVVEMHPDGGACSVPDYAVIKLFHEKGSDAWFTDAPESYLTESQEEYRRRRDFLVKGLNEIPGVYSPLPMGAFYTVVSLPVPDAEEFCKWCLREFSYNGTTGYVHSDYVSLSGVTNGGSSTGSSNGSVKGSDVRMRSGPSTNYSILGTYQNGTPLTITGTENGWTKVTIGGVSGYIRSDYVSGGGADSKAGYIKGTGVRMRSGASTTSSILGVYNTGTEMTITGESGNWYKVSYSGRDGYVSKDYMTTTKPDNGGGSTSQTGYIKGNDVRLRSGAGTNYSILGTYNNGTPLTITGTSGNWTAVTINGVKGYVNSAYVTTTKSDGGSKPSGSIGETIVATAKQYMGAPYVYGGMSPSGFDCSGFVNYVYKLCGYSMSRVASSIYNNNGTYVEKANLQLGDLVFFASNSSSIGHVGIYIGNGQFIHSSSGAGCVVISDLSSSYYLKNYVGAKRIAG